METKDILHFYIGQDVTICEYEGAPFTCKLTGLITERTDHESMIRIQCFIPDEQEPNTGHIAWYDLDELVDVHLRKLSNMTEEETKILLRLRYNEEDVVGLEQKYSTDTIRKTFIIMMNSWTPNEFIWLLKQGFDLFGLIDAGLAIDNKSI